MADHGDDVFMRIITLPNVMNIIEGQLYAMKARDVLPTGISLSMNLLMCSSLAPYLIPTGHNEQKLLGIPLTVIADKDDVIAWSINL